MFVVFVFAWYFNGYYMYIVTDLTCSDRWKDVKQRCLSMNNPELFSEVEDAVISGKESSTTRNYSLAFNKFVTWCEQFQFSSLPADVVTVALYLVTIIQRKDKCGKSKLNQIFYAINWAHEFAAVKNPCVDNWLKLCLQGCIRKVSTPIVKKEPITIEILQNLVTRFASENCCLGDLRLVTLFVLAFAGFFRINEVLQLKRSDIHVFDAYCTAHISKSKTDTLRQGNEVLLARTNRVTCPVSLLERYFKSANIDDTSPEHLFRPVYFISKDNKYVLRTPKDKPLSYTRVRELFKEKITVLGLDASKYGLHSFRSGAASVSANSGTNERLWQRHGRWKSVSAKDGYVKDSLKDRLAVTLNLGL